MTGGVKAVLQHLLRDDGALLALARPGLDGLTDDEYLWEPVEHAWSIRPRDRLRTAQDLFYPDGEWTVEIEYPDPSPPPFTTIAWRMVHLTGSMFEAMSQLRGAATADGWLDESWPENRAVAVTAAEAVDRFWFAVGEVQRRLAAADEADLWRTNPPLVWGMESKTDVHPMWRNVEFFAHFEPASHLAEVRLLRDLYRHTDGGRTPLRATDGLGRR